MKKEKNTELIICAARAMSAGMTYGQYQTKCYLERTESIREKRIRQGKYNPTIRKNTGDS